MLSASVTAKPSKTCPPTAKGPGTERMLDQDLAGPLVGGWGGTSYPPSQKCAHCHSLGGNWWEDKIDPRAREAGRERFTVPFGDRSCLSSGK